MGRYSMKSWIIGRIFFKKRAKVTLSYMEMSLGLLSLFFIYIAFHIIDPLLAV